MTKKTVFALCAAAVAGALSQAPFNLFFLAFFQFLPLFLLSPAEARGHFFRYLFYGILLNLLLLYWIPRVMVQYGGTTWPLGISGLAALALFLGLFYALFGLAAAPWLNRLPQSRLALLLIPALWVGKDLLVERIFGGFPWCLAGYSQHNNLLFLQLAETGGVHLLTFLLVFSNMLIYRCWIKRDRKQLTALLLIPLLHLAGWGLLHLHRQQVNDLPRQTAGIIQPNVTPDDHRTIGSIEQELERLLEVSEELARSGASFVIWPEYTVPVYPGQSRRHGDLLDVFAAEKVPLLAGFTDLQAPDRIYNSLFLFHPAGRESYAKVKLTPFGEYIPFRRLLFFVRRITDEIGDFTPGESLKNLRLNDLRISPPICYEVIFPELVRNLICLGGQVIITTSNDSWFGNTSAPYQHLSMAVLRAVENRRFLLRATSNGISALVDSAGTVLRKSSYGRADAFTATFPALDQKTFFTRTGYLFPWFCALFSLAALLTRVFIKLHRKHRSLPGANRGHSIER